LFYLTGLHHRHAINANPLLGYENGILRTPAYISGLTVLIFQHITALAAMRVGKIDQMNIRPLYTDRYHRVQQTNPEINVIKVPSAALDILPKSSVAPFNILNVRIAMQQALNYL